MTRWAETTCPAKGEEESMDSNGDIWRALDYFCFGSLLLGPRHLFQKCETLLYLRHNKSGFSSSCILLTNWSKTSFRSANNNKKELEAEKKIHTGWHHRTTKNPGHVSNLVLKLAEEQHMGLELELNSRDFNNGLEIPRIFFCTPQSQKWLYLCSVCPQDDTHVPG